MPNFLGRWWYGRRTRLLLLQAAAAAVIFAVAGWIAQTTATHLAERNMSAGFGFLSQHAGFVIGETLIPFDAEDSYLRAVMVCGLNTVFVSLIACAAATILGVAVGLGRLAANPVLQRLASLYVLLFRNTPLLLQMILWYALLQALPPVRQALSLAGAIFLSQRGLRLPALEIEPEAFLGTVVAIATAAVLLWRAGARWRLPMLTASLFVGVVALYRWPIGIDYPVRRGFNFVGGLEMTPEFTALLAGLTLYYAAYIAEIVRGGILAVPNGQWEAARALGLSAWRVMRHVVVPQALRVITPPLTLEYVGIIKSSSLGILVGYPELFWSVSAMIAQTGHAIEGITLLMLAYLVPSLAAAAGMNALNRRLLRTEGGMTGQVLSGAPPRPRLPQLGWRRLAPLFGTRGNAALSLAGLAAIALLAPSLLRWAVLDAVFTGSRDACQAAAGACWAFVWEKLSFFQFGFYPPALRWRPGMAVLVIAILIGASLFPRLWRPGLLLGWLVGSALAIVLMMGAPTDQWGGLPVSLMVTLAGVLGGMPLGVLLALGRRARELPFIRLVCVLWIELVRGVPLISILFIVNVMAPLFLPQVLTPEKLTRALIAYALAASAYFAEALRGGLQGMPATQEQAARALGLTYWQAVRLVVLPQALRTAIPPLANTVISFIKETSLVMVIGLFDLVGTVQLAARDPQWLVTGTEGYLFVGVFYLALCAATSAYAGWLERRSPRMV